MEVYDEAPVLVWYLNTATKFRSPLTCTEEVVETADEDLVLLEVARVDQSKILEGYHCSHAVSGVSKDFYQLVACKGLNTRCHERR